MAANLLSQVVSQLFRHRVRWQQTLQLARQSAPKQPRLLVPVRKSIPVTFGEPCVREQEFRTKERRVRE